MCQMCNVIFNFLSYASVGCILLTGIKMKKKLLIVAHPNMNASFFNKGLLESVKNTQNFTVHQLYSLYPDFKINVKKEQDLLIANDVIIFQHPLQWYSCPALLKLWIDEVLAYGFAYGEGGNALHGKEWRSVVTSAGGDLDYLSGGNAGYTISELMRPFQMTATHSGMSWKPVFSVTGASPMESESKRKAILEAGCKRYSEYISSI